MNPRHGEALGFESAQLELEALEFLSNVAALIEFQPWKLKFKLYLEFVLPRYRYINFKSTHFMLLASIILFF